MSLKAAYERFLANPTLDALSSDAALNYITTATNFASAEAIIKHLLNQRRQLKKTSENILNIVEGPSSLCLDVETTLHFIGGGGAYLLRLDDNFLVDRDVTLPMIHIVHFDSQNKISQIRVYWDQGSLLKQLEVIGSSLRNWPIRDASEQTRLITSSVAAAASSSSIAAKDSSTTTSTPVSQKSKFTDGFDDLASDTFSPSKRHVKDPHSSLALFEPHSPPESKIHPLAQRGSSAKPPPRDYGDLFIGNDSDSTPTKGPSSPSKFKESKNYRASRLFGEDDDEADAPKRSMKTNPKKYSHFEFENGPEVHESTPVAAPTREHTKYHHFEFGQGPEVHKRVEKPNAPPLEHTKYHHFEFGHGPELHTREERPAVPPLEHTKYHHFEFGQPSPEEPKQPKKPHVSQWYDFDEGPSPDKPKPKVRGQDVRHFGWSDDEEIKTPAPKPRAVNPRRDAETHFQFRDDGTPIAHQKLPVRAKGTAHNNGLGLYENNLYDDTGMSPKKATKEPLGVLPNGAHRKKDFDSHWEATDPEPNAAPTKVDENKNMTSDRMKAVKMMDHSWDAYEDLADDEQPVTRAPTQKRISRDVNQRSWGFGVDRE